MTLVISITTPDGVVMASDSRQVLKNPNRISRISTDNATKLFKINDRTVIGVAGMAFFEDETGNNKSIETYINDFCSSVDLEDISIEDTSRLLHEYLSKKYDWKRKLDELSDQLRSNVKNQNGEIIKLEKENNIVKFIIRTANGVMEEGSINVEPINILVNGFDKDGFFKTYEVLVPGEISRKRDKKECGCTWIGQGDVVSRMILGYEGRLLDTPILKEAISNHGTQTVLNQFRGAEYNIQWPLLTLQDSINLAVFLIEATATINFYADGITMNPGQIQGVGGSIDVVAITKNDGVKWIRHKELSYPD